MGAGASKGLATGVQASTQEELAAALTNISAEQKEKIHASISDSTKAKAAFVALPVQGVRVGWLKEFFRKIGEDMATANVVEDIVKPQTVGKKCRYIELLSTSDKAHPKVFVSHTWRAKFRDLSAWPSFMCVTIQPSCGWTSSPSCSMMVFFLRPLSWILHPWCASRQSSFLSPHTCLRSHRWRTAARGEQG